MTFLPFFLTYSTITFLKFFKFELDKKEEGKGENLISMFLYQAMIALKVAKHPLPLTDNIILDQILNL